MAKLGVFLLEGSADECRLFLDDSTLIGVSLTGTDGLDEVYVGRTLVVLEPIGRRFILAVSRSGDTSRGVVFMESWRLKSRGLFV